MKRVYIVLLICFPLWAWTAVAEIESTSSVIDGFGGRSSGAIYENTSAAGQPGGVQYGTAGGLGETQNYAGFMGTFSLRPALIAEDGLERELSADNDGDGLGDHVEITGSTFDPITPTDPNAGDTSGDGISDHAHAVAGTDPTSAGSYLRILAIGQEDDDMVLTWRARQDRSYRILYAEDSHTSPTNLLDTAVGDPGIGPWQVTTNTISFPASGTLQTFGIEVQSP